MLRSIAVAGLLFVGIVKDLPPPAAVGAVSSGIVTEPTESTGTYVVEALEGPGVAALESNEGVRILVPRTWLPASAREGHVLQITRSERDGRTSVRVAIDEAATEERRSAMRERREALPKGPKGDLDL